MTPSRAVTLLTRAMERRGVCDWVFERYLGIAPPSFVGPSPRRPAVGRRTAATATATATA